MTTINPLTLEEWEATHGRLYRAAIDRGVMSVMSAHIAFPAFAAAMGADGVELYRPASVSRHLNEGLLRERLGFNGVIVSDATPMAGFGAWAPREVMLPEVIENGCDVILFSDDPEITRPSLARLRETADQIREAGIDGVAMKELSMGMSGDLEVAIEEGATIVRVGSAVFGERKTP